VELAGRRIRADPDTIDTLYCWTGGLIFWEMHHRSPVVNFRPLGERNFSACCIIIFGAYAVLYGYSISLPGLLQSLFGYNALQAGLVLSPAGFFAILTLPVVARILGRPTDARWVILTGLLVMAAGNYWMSQLNLDISPGQVVWPRVVLIVGLSMCFAPANVAAYLYTPMELRGAAVGLFSLLRNEGGSVGSPLSQALQDHREQFHTLRLGEYLDPLNPSVNSFTEQSQAFFLQQTGDPPCRRSSLGKLWRIYASNRRRPLPISTAFGCSPW
jgi:DHA2 family multidrug resistance protein